MGIDRFYYGKFITGTIKLLTFGGGGIWHLIDIFLIPYWTRRENQAIVYYFPEFAAPELIEKYPEFYRYSPKYLPELGVSGKLIPKPTMQNQLQATMPPTAGQSGF